MKKQICFAGFADGELALLQPSLAAMGGSWDCVFAPDADSALDSLGRIPFDALVANLSAGGIHDAEFLEKVAQEHPRALRFILGHVSDRELMIHCMGTAHQFISRPWKPQDLVSILKRSLALDAWLSNDKLRSFVPRLGKLPGLPASYFEVIRKAESPHASVETISEVISRDPALTARLLHMANSPACGLTEKITSPAEAVSMLGIETVKSLVLCLQLFAQSAPTEGACPSLDQLWHHSFNVAKLAARIVLRCIGSERMAGDAYTAGLLHNIGQILLATNLSREYSRVVETARNLKCPLQESEMQLLGVTRHQVGAYLLGLWGMPLPLLESTALHDTPNLTQSVEFSVLTAVHVANVLASEETGRIKGLPLPKLDTEYLAALELPNRPEAWGKFLDSAPKHVEVALKPAEDRAPAVPVARDESARPKGKFLVLAGFAATLVVAVAMLRNQAPDATQGAPVVALKTAPSPGGPVAPRRTEATKAPPDESAFDSIKIQGIVYHAGHSVVLINGSALDVGSMINGVKVVSIDRSNVVLTCNGVKKTFLLK